MSFISKISGNLQNTISPQAKKLPNRFISSNGFMTKGAAYHAPRTNSSEEIIESLKLLAKEEAEKAKKYRKDIVELSQKGGYDIEANAEKYSQDIIYAALSKHRDNAEKTKQFVARGYTLSNAQRQEYNNLQEIAAVATSARAAELKSKEISEFINMTKEMPQRHLSLAHDVVDLSNTHAFVNNNIFPSVDFNSIGRTKSTNKETTLMGYILGLLPKLSKENPKAVDLAETVLSHTDDVNSKFFLTNFLENAPVTPLQTELTEKMVPNIAKDTLKGMPSMEMGKNSKENTFFTLINNLCASNSKPENLNLMNDLLKHVDTICKKTDAVINIDEIRLGNTETIRENMKILPEVLKNAEAQGKDIDASGFLTKNVNLF